MARYGELFLKSEPVRHHFIGMLLRNIRDALAANGLSHGLKPPADASSSSGMSRPVSRRS